MKAVASHQCGWGSIPGPGVICRLSSLLVFAPAPRVFSGFSGFSLLTKTNTSKFKFHREFKGHRFACCKTVKGRPR